MYDTSLFIRFSVSKNQFMIVWQCYVFYIVRVQSQWSKVMLDLL